MLKHRKLAPVIIILLVLCFILLGLFNYKQPKLLLTLADRPSCLINSNNFSFSWIHSVELEEWRENYQLSNNKIILTESLQRTFGAGSPYGDAKVSQADGWVKLEVNLILNQFSWLGSAQVDPKIITNNYQLKLAPYLKSPSTITIIPTPLNYFNILSWSKCESWN